MSRVSSLAKSLRELRLDHQDMLERKSMFDHDVHRAINALTKLDDLSKKSNSQQVRTLNPPPSPPESIPIPEESECEKKEEESNDTQSDRPSWAKKAYRKIALLTHPDKIMQDQSTTDAQKDRLLVLYREATNAYQEGKYDLLAEIAAELDIDLDLPEIEREIALEKKIKSLRDEMQSVMKSVSWVWGNSFGDIDLRVRVLKRCCQIIKMNAPDDLTLVSIVRELESQPEFDIVDRLGAVRRIKSGGDRRKVGTRPERLIKRG
jgi:hypothetical protein